VQAHVAIIANFRTRTPYWRLDFGTQKKSPARCGSKGGRLLLLVLRPEMQGPDSQFASANTYKDQVDLQSDISYSGSWE